jgi:hypothetical protein
MTSRRFRRTTWLIDTDIQVKLAVKFAACLMCYLVLFCVVALTDPLVALVSGESAEIRNKAAAEIGEFLPTVLLPLGFAAACMVLHGILLLHKLAGPVYRLRRGLGALANRDLTDDIYLRQGDFLRSTVVEYNDSLTTIRMDLDAVREEADAILAAQAEGPVREHAERLSLILDLYRLRADDPSPEETAEDPQPEDLDQEDLPAEEPADATHPTA